MIATNNFVFLHLHKSGGTFVNNFLKRFFVDAQMIGYHLPGKMIPEKYSELPVFGFVRNPYSYYVAWFAFQSSMIRPNALFRVVSCNGHSSFSETIRNLNNISCDTSIFDAVYELLPDDFPNKGINLTKNCITKFKGSNVGFYSFMYKRLFSGIRHPFIGQMEKMRIDLPRLMGKMDIKLSNEMKRHIQFSEKLNTSNHGKIADYYDAELAKYVRHKDILFFERFGY